MERPEKWEQEVEEEEEELLRGRKSRNENDGTEFNSEDASSIITVTNGHSDNNGDKMQLSAPVNGAEDLSAVQKEVSHELEISSHGGFDLSQQAVAEELKISSHGGFDLSQRGVPEELDIRNGGFEDVEKLLRAESEDVNGSSERCVYFDDDKGTGFNNGVSLTEENSIGLEKEPADDRLKVNPPVDQILKHNDLPVSSTQPSEVSITETEIESESESETIDLDVEGVLAKQNTHNLYCPKCNSCITRRVILRKRKRTIRTSSEEPERIKLRPLIGSQPDAIPDDAISTVDTHLDENPAVEVNDGVRDQEPDVFRCLSCFSIFIPSEGGFKLFRMFGDKSKKESIQDTQQLPSVKKNWFSSIFSPDKLEVVVVDEGTNQSTSVTKDNLGTQSSNLNEQRAEGSSSLPVPSPAETFVAEPKKNGNNIISSSAASIYFEEPIIDVGEKLNTATSNRTDEKDIIVSSRTPISVLGEPVMNGKKVNDISSQIPRYNQQQNVGAALLPETIVEDENQKVKEGYKDEKEELFLSSTPVSVPGEKHMNEKVNTSLHIPPRDDEKNGVAAHVTEPITEDGTKFVKLSDGPYHSEFSHKNTITTTWDIYTEKPLNDDTRHQISSAQDASLLQGGQVDIGKIFNDMTSHYNHSGKDTIITVESERVETSASQISQDIISSSQNEASPRVDALTGIVEERDPTARNVRGLEIIKSIVYGGLIESITSLGVISSAAGSDASTVNVLALGIANLIGGLFVIGHDLWEMKESQRGGASNQVSEQVDRYQELLGRRSNFTLHAIIAVISFLVFGLIPPVIYGFSFRQSNDRDLKLMVVAIASLLCVILLAVGKAYVRRPPKSYFKSMMYYVVIGTMASGASYVAGGLIMKLLHKLGLFEPTQGFSVLEPGSGNSAWASY